MNEQQEKRMVGNTGYEVRQAFHINGKEILIAENMKAEDGMIYLVCNYEDRGIIAEYSQAVTGDDYLEAVQEFTGRVSKEAAAVEAERGALDLPGKLFTAEDCHPHNYAESIAGKVVAIKVEVLSPEYRRGDVQLVYAESGNGTNANPRGNAVYCYHLNDGKHTRFERFEVLGVVKALPDWAKENLARIQAEKDRPAAAKEFAGNYEIVERIEVGQKVFALGHCGRAACPYGTWQGFKHGTGNFDWGHYFNDYETAKTDLHDRAAKEQGRLDGKMRSDKESR